VAAERRARSEKLRAARAFRADLRYGVTARERIDFFPAAQAGAPLLAFIHGGYWQTNDKEHSSFLAEGPLAHGISFALIEYTLAPEADIDRIVGEIERAVAWLHANAVELGADPARLYLSGHSAGGHLSAMMLGRSPIAGAIAISGLYDLEPIRLNYLNEKLRLTEASARRNSPIRNLVPQSPPVTITVGADELPELVRQSADYAAALQSRGAASQYLAVEKHDHFSILEELARPDGKLCTLLSRLASGFRATPLQR
jgi:acetyl esterase/lipase